MSKNVIDIATGEVRVASGDQIIRTSGIGSCVVITLHDKENKIGAMAHPMLAEYIEDGQGNLLRFVDYAVDAMLRLLDQKGANKDNLKAKIIGGSNMFRAFDDNPKSIGTNNIRAVKEKLKKEGLNLVANDTGGSISRSVSLDIASGLVEIIAKA